MTGRRSPVESRLAAARARQRPRRSRRGRPAGGLRGVRVRITLVAAVVTGVAVLLAGWWLVDAVEGSLTDELRSADEAQVQAVVDRLEAGQGPDELGLATLGRSGETPWVQVVQGGRVVSSTPSAAGLSPLDDTLVVRRNAVAGGQPAGAYTVTSGVAAGPGGRYAVVAASPLTSVHRSVDAVRDGLFVALPLLVGAVAALAWVLAGRALHPVEAIRAEVEEISGSTLARRVPVPSSGDEVARLARTMNAMLDRLEAASTRQQRFVADASHELRSPVATIRTELEVARLSGDTDGWPAVVDRLLAEEGRLEAVIADLLLLASLDEGAPLPAVAEVDLAALAVDEAGRARPAGADGPDVRVTVDAPAPVPVDGSPVQLRRALANLVDNAVHHARSSVVVTVAVVEGRARVAVDDDGPGIAPEDRERVFDRFTRLDDHRARPAGGTGLGLALVRSIARRHRGTVSLATSPAGGARLELDLPAAAR